MDSLNEDVMANATSCAGIPAWARCDAIPRRALRLGRWFGLCGCVWALVGWIGLGRLEAQQPFDCDDHAWVVLTPPGASSKLYRIIRDTFAEAEPVFVHLFDLPGYQVEAMGFNVRDKLLYGLDLASHSLLQIGADGVVTNLGVPLNLDTTLEYHAGAAKPEGGRLFVVGRQPDGADRKLYTISLQPPYYAGIASIVSDDPVRMGDIAFDPIFGALLGFDENAHRVVHLTTGGAVSTYPWVPQPQLGAAGSLYFDPSGKLFAWAGSPGAENRLVRLERFTGRQIEDWPLAAFAFSDGTSCPWRLYLQKEIEPRRVLPCSEFTITYRTLNRAGISYGNLTLEDAFPPDFKIAKVQRQPGLGEDIQGMGTQQLSATGYDVLLGKDSLVIVVTAGNFAGEVATQAALGPLPLGLGGEVLSDDPSTAPFPDPTMLEVVADSRVLEADTFYLCQGATLRLQAARGGLNYWWSSGQTTPDIEVDAPGTYAVRVEGACGIFRDTAVVLGAEPPVVELGADRSYPFGSEVVLESSVSGEDFDLRWQANGAELTCYSCATPRLTLTTDVEVILTVKDQRGCTATDTLHLSALPERKVYLPTAFSPNGDGINDVFYPQGISDFPFSHFRVYDRWGGRVFHQPAGRLNDPAHGWDGRRNGQPLPAGLYRWELRVHFSEMEQRNFSGNLILIR